MIYFIHTAAHTAHIDKKNLNINKFKLTWSSRSKRRRGRLLRFPEEATAEASKAGARWSRAERRCRRLGAEKTASRLEIRKKIIVDL